MLTSSQVSGAIESRSRRGQSEGTTPDLRGRPVEANQAVLLVDAADPTILDVPVVGSVGFLTGEVSVNVRRAVHRARVYLGCAGWDPGQLEAEVDADSWIVEEPSEDDIFTADPGGLWRRILQRKGPPYAILAQIPFNPSTN